MKIPYKTGMIYRSETHPQFDMIIDYVNYEFTDTGKIDNFGTFICWCNINRVKFDEFTDEKLGKDRKNTSTFPYAFFGECKLNSIKQRLRKYNLEFFGTSEDIVTIYNNDEYEYCSGFKERHSKLSE